MTTKFVAHVSGVCVFISTFFLCDAVQGTLIEGPHGYPGPEVGPCMVNHKLIEGLPVPLLLVIVGVVVHSGVLSTRGPQAFLVPPDLQGHTGTQAIW